MRCISLVLGPVSARPSTQRGYLVQARLLNLMMGKQTEPEGISGSTKGSSYVAVAPGIVLLDHGLGNVDANTAAELGSECLIAG